MKAGSIRERRPGVFEFRAYVGRDPVTNLPRWKSKTWRGTKRAAGMALAQWVTEVRRENVETTETVAGLLDAWMKLQTNAGLSPTTLRTYSSYINGWLLPAFGPRRLDDLTAGHVREFHAKMNAAGKSPSTIRQAHNILRGALAYAVEREWVDQNVAAIRKPPRQSSAPVVAPSLTELRSLLAAAGEPGCDLWACVALAATLGARAGELCALRWSDIDLEAKTVTISRSVYTVKGTVGVKVPKSGKSRTTSIDDVAVAALVTRRVWQEDRWQRVHGGPHPTELIEDPYVLSFWSDGSGPPRPDSYSTAFGKLRDSLGLGHLHLHSLRHFMVSYLLDAGASLAVVSERAGHSSPAVTARIYAHPVAGRDKEAAALLGRVLMP